jgi:hypothetical protein
MGVAKQPQEDYRHKRGEEETQKNPYDSTASSRFSHSGRQQDEQPKGEVQGCQSNNHDEKTFDHASAVPRDDKFTATLSQQVP